MIDGVIHIEVVAQEFLEQPDAVDAGGADNQQAQPVQVDALSVGVGIADAAAMLPEAAQRQGEIDGEMDDEQAHLHVVLQPVPDTVSQRGLHRGLDQQEFVLAPRGQQEDGQCQRNMQGSGQEVQPLAAAQGVAPRLADLAGIEVEHGAEEKFLRPDQHAQPGLAHTQPAAVEHGVAQGTGVGEGEQAQIDVRLAAAAATAEQRQRQEYALGQAEQVENRQDERLQVHGGRALQKPAIVRRAPGAA